MRSVVGTCLVGVMLATVGCQSQAPVHESLTFSFKSSGGSGDGGFVCYPSAYGGWLCEAGTADGWKKKALHIDPETESMRAMFELVKDAAAVAEEPERVAERQRHMASFERSLDKPLRVSKSWLDVAYTGGEGKEVIMIDGWKLCEALRVHPEVTHLYREVIGSLGGLPKVYGFRDLAPTPQEIGQRQYLKRLKQLKDPIIILSEQPRDWVPTPGQYVQLMGVAKDPQKGFSCVETGSHGDWLTPLKGRWPEDVVGHRVSLIGVVELYTPEAQDENALRQDYCGPVHCVSVSLWERVADE